MPTGTALKKDNQQGLEGLGSFGGLDPADALDAAIRRGLRRGAPGSAPGSTPGSTEDPAFQKRAEPEPGTNLGSALSAEPASSPSSYYPPKASPETDLLPDENLLRYVDGSLVATEHTAFEHRLLHDPQAREQVAVLKSCQTELSQGQGEAAPAKDKARYVLAMCSGTWRFLRGSDSPSPSSSPFCFDFTHKFSSSQAQLKIEAKESEHLYRQLNLSLSMNEGGLPLCADVSLWRDGNVVLPSPLPLDPDGMVRFFGLTPARYELLVLKKSSEVARLVVDVRADSSR